MNGLVIILIGIVALAAGYLLYGGWLAKKWGIDPNAKTPAYTHEDGQDYVPSSRFTVFSHQFSSIAGAGPVTGPILASVFGWVPVLLWLIIGGLFFGAVQDFGALYASVKNEGKSIGMVIEKYIGKTGRRLFMLFCWLFTLLVIAAFTDMVAGTFVGVGAEVADEATAYANSAAASISMLFILVAILFGLYEKLLFALGNILRRFRSCILFLLPVALGGAVGLAVGFFAVRALLGICPFAVVALFAGLMLGAYPAVTDNLRGEKRTPARILLFAAGVALPVALGLAAVFASPGSLWPESIGLLPCLLFLLLGFLVALTQVVPGLSATALLMLVGCFAPLLDSVSLTYWRQNPAVFLLYGCLAVGFLAGLVLCSKGIGRLLARRRAPAFFAIGGLSLGSFASMFFNPEIFEVYRGWAEGAPFAADLWSGVLLFAAGLAAAYVLVRFERKKNGK